MYSYVAFEGVIGAGKTTYTKVLAEEYQAKQLLEIYEDNPFLEQFYSDTDKFAFPLELSFLASRYDQLKNVLESKEDLFQNKIFSDFVLYKSLVFASINLSGDKLALYKKLFNIMFLKMPIPDVTIYLQLPIDRLQENIAKRGRSYEMKIPNEYLENLQENYLSYFKQLSQHKIVIFDVRKHDILTNPHTKETLKEILNTPFQKGITYI